MKNNKTLNNILILAILAIISFFTAYIFRTSLYMLIGIIINSFKTLVLNLPFVLSGLSFVALFFLTLKEKYVRPISKRRALIEIIVLLFLNLVSLVLFIVQAQIYINNCSYVFDFMYVAFPLINCVSLSFLIIKLIKLIQNKAPLLKEENIVSIKIGHRVYITTLCLLSLYCLYSLFQALLTAKNILVNPIGYLYFIFTFLIIVFDAIYAVIREKGAPKSLHVVALCLNSCILLSSLILMFTMPNFYVQVGKVFTLGDFAMSFPILPILVFIAEVKLITISSISICKK